MVVMLFELDVWGSVISQMNLYPTYLLDDDTHPRIHVSQIDGAMELVR